MKKIVGISLFVGIGALAWYLWFWEGEYRIRLRVKTIPGDIVQTVRIWTRAQKGMQVTTVDSTKLLIQEIEYDGHFYKYKWVFEPLTDSTTEIKVIISEPGFEIRNKLSIPFSDTHIEATARTLGYEFNDVMKEHLRITRVKIDGVSESVSSFCACSTIESAQIDKALGMMRTYSLLTSFIADNNLEVTGKPIVNVVSWNHNQGELKFDFCFPIAKQDQLPELEYVVYRALQGGKALKATYNGNYITSDRAWYYLYQYAANNGLTVTGLPVEVFFNNPNVGANQEEWRADIFLPVE